MPKQYGLSRPERLRGRTAVSNLFDGDESKAVTAFPLRIVYRKNNEQINRILVSVPKRHLHHAVDRNRVKRQVREAYRLNKQQFSGTQHYDMAFIYLTDKTIESAEITKRLTTLLGKICTAQEE